MIEERVDTLYIDGWMTLKRRMFNRYVRMWRIPINSKMRVVLIDERHNHCSRRRSVDLRELR
jgi:hypothetical protein